MPRKGSLLRELPILVVVALAVSLVIKSFLVQFFYIPSGSMENTLQVNDRVAVFALACELDPGDAQAQQLLLDQAEHLGELREQQNFAALGHHLGQHVEQLLEFGRLLHLAGRAQFEQARVATDLAQLEQRIQNGDLRFGQTLRIQGVAHGFFHAQADGFVQVGLLALQGHGHQGLDLGRQLAALFAYTARGCHHGHQSLLPGAADHRADGLAAVR